MATDEERASAKRRIDIHRKNLRELEERAATYAADVPLHIVNQMDVERVKIASLEPIANPPRSDDTQAFVTQAGEGNWAMLFSQFVLLNTRMTKQEEQNQRILDEQFRASEWRIGAGEDIQDLKSDRDDRMQKQGLNFKMQLASLIVSFATAILVYVLLVRAGIL